MKRDMVTVEGCLRHDCIQPRTTSCRAGEDQMPLVS